MSHYAFVFPGQGSQSVGMGRDWADSFEEARRTFEEADDVLGFSLSGLCFEGPDEELQLTANTQPAILTASVAVHRVLAARKELAPVAMAGHSLGEYSAQVAAGTLSLADALRLVRRRGQLMQEAVPVGEGAMAAIIGLGQSAVEEVLAGIDEAAAERCVLANINSPQQMVIAGHAAAVERAAAAAKAAGAKMAKMLPVSAPFHSPLMAPARERLEPELRKAEFHDPKTPVVSNVDAEPVTEGTAAREALIRQVDGAVRWVEGVEKLMALGASHFVELGPGRVLTGLGKRIDRSKTWTATPSPEALDELLAQLA